MTYTVEKLFFNSIYVSNINEETIKSKSNVLDSFKKDIKKNIGNFITNDKYILKNKKLKSLEKEILSHVNIFAKQVMKYKNVEFYITQSWLNYTTKNENHHIHTHPNSIFSGVVYLDVSKEDKIYFFADKYQQIEIVPTEYNEFNSKSWWLPVKNNNIIIFDSSLSHGVENKKEDNVRFSLAFNTFAKGNFGEYKASTELIL